MIVAAAALAVIASAGLYWWLLRRRAPVLTTSDLPPAANSMNKDVVLSIETELSDKDRLAIFNSFAVGDDARWMVAGKQYIEDDQASNSALLLDKKEELLRITSYMIGTCLCFVHNYGHMIVARDNNGQFLGAMGLVPPYSNHRIFDLHFMRSAIPMGNPKTILTDKSVRARFDAFCKDIPKQHRDAMHGCIAGGDWYVAVLGVSENSQGKGVGRLLMQAAIAMAEAEAESNNKVVAPIYLDCNDSNVPFYEKSGFKRQIRSELEPKGIDDTTTFGYNGMVYGNIR